MGLPIEHDLKDSSEKAAARHDELPAFSGPVRSHLQKQTDPTVDTITRKPSALGAGIGRVPAKRLV